MVAKLPIRIMTFCTLALLVLPMSSAQQSRKSDARNSQKEQPGLLDFALSTVNPKNQNYGQCYDETRDLLIHETFERAYFWSNVFAIALAGFLFVVVVHQRRCQKRVEKIASESVAQYHNALERAEAHIVQATSRNRALMQALSTSVTDNNASPAGDLVLQRRSAGRPPRDTSTPAAKAPAQPKAGEAAQSVATQSPSLNTSASSAPNNGCEKPKPDDQKTVTAITPSVAAKISLQEKPRQLDQMGLFGSEVELISKINLLQQQLSSSQEREKHLRRQLNDSELRFQKEQQKSRTLQS